MQRYVFKDVQCIIVYNIEKLETTQMPIKRELVNKLQLQSLRKTKKIYILM